MKIISFIKPNLAFVAAVLLLGTIGCKKLSSTYLDTGVAVDQVILQYKTGTNPTTGSSVSPTAYGTGLGGFANANVVITGSSPDTLRYTIVATYSSTAIVAPKDVPVTIGVDDSKRTTYNSTSTIPYNAFTSSMYRIVKTALTIKAGMTYDTTVVEVYSQKVDLSKSWMLPVVITNASGVQLSGNQNTVYFHIIGNPIAGNYAEHWTRWNAADTTGTPAFNQEVGPVPFLPVSPTSISVASNGTGETDILSFTNTGGVLSNFQVSFDPASTTTITITGGPILQYADPVKGIYRIFFTYTNSAGAPRAIINLFTKQ